jgi:hypothetical protein
MKLLRLLSDIDIAATEQLLSNLPQFVRRVLQQIDHAHSSFSLELLGAADCHMDCTFDDVSLQARAPVAHFLLDPTESSVSAAMPGMEVDFRYTPEDLLQMSWHVAERADVPRAQRRRQQHLPPRRLQPRLPPRRRARVGPRPLLPAQHGLPRPRLPRPAALQPHGQ